MLYGPGTEAVFDGVAQRYRVGVPGPEHATQGEPWPRWGIAPITRADLPSYRHLETGAELYQNRADPLRREKRGVPWAGCRSMWPQ